MIEPTEKRRLLDAVCGIARDAGRAILEVYARDFAVALKADRSPLTEADEIAHAIIDRSLRALTPEIPVLSEEAAPEQHADRQSWTQFWLVDPLDGTKEFLKRNGEFTVNIALVDAGVPVMSVVHVPVTGISYLACAGRGAFKQEPGAEPLPSQAR